jgi:hypothetical protein
MRNGVVSSIDFRDRDYRETDVPGAAIHEFTRPTRDLLGTAFFIFHLAVSCFIVTGWLVPNASALVFYLAFLPLVAMQWQVNCGSCVIDNLETFLRTRRWRDPGRSSEGRFFSMLLLMAFGIKARRAHTDLISYGGLLVLWLFAFRHLSVLGDPAFLSLFP